jgi:peroxiredoxin
MRFTLYAAAVYNALWGTAVVFFPHELLRAAGLEATPYPDIVRCLGMVVGVYGMAYAIAATDPTRHWAIVLTGLVGKILGPIGFLDSASAGRLPWRMGWMILANDLVWWIPFCLILWKSYEAYVVRQRAISPEVVRFALRTRTNQGMTLEQMSRRSPVLLVFLRHLGCTFCREALADLGAQRREIEAAGAAIVLVHMTTDDSGNNCFKDYGLCGLAQISDPCQHVYRAFGLKRGSLTELFGPRVLLRGFGLLPKHGLGRMLGDAFQMPGVFLLYHGEVVRSYRHRSVADRPPYARFVAGPDAMELGVHI